MVYNVHKNEYNDRENETIIGLSDCRKLDVRYKNRQSIIANRKAITYFRQSINRKKKGGPIIIGLSDLRSPFCKPNIGQRTNDFRNFTFAMRFLD